MSSDQTQPAQDERQLRAVDRALRFFTFLRELSRLGGRSIRDLGDYEDVFWLVDVPATDECRSITHPDAIPEDLPDGVWLEIRQPDVRVVPTPPMVTNQWLENVEVDNPERVPELNRLRTTTRLLPSGETEQIEQRIEDTPNVVRAWDEYLDARWMPWADEVRDRYPVSRLYHQLFSIYRKQLTLGEQYEVVLGLGELRWKLETGEVRRHVITLPVEVRFNAAQGVIGIGPIVGDSTVRLEIDMLDPTALPTDPQIAEGLRETIALLGDDALTDPAIPEALQTWVHALAAGGRYDDRLEPGPPPGDRQPQITWSPALILRKRSERAIIDFYDSVIADIKGGSVLPAGLEHILTEASSVRPGISGPAKARETSLADSVLFFPLPTNEEQRQIVDRLESNSGVLVQGPPGTGKSHTIANLICHLLATGNRVLVTAQAARALEVLRDKLPAEIRDLCVSLLGQDRRSLRRLEDSVHGITSQFASWDEQRERNRDTKLLLELRSATEREQAAMQELVDLKADETQAIDKFGYSGTPQKIAEQLFDEGESFAWFLDAPTDGSLGDLDPSKLSNAAATLGALDDAAYSEAHAEVPELSHVPTAEAFASLIARYREHESIVESLSGDPTAHGLNLYDDVTLVQVRDIAGSLAATLKAVETRAEEWAPRALADVLGERDRPWRELRDTTAALLERLDIHHDVLRDTDVTGLEDINLTIALADARAMLERFGAGKGWGLPLIGAQPAKRARYIRQSIRINGALVEHSAAMRTLADWLDGKIAAQKLVALWHEQANVSLPSAPNSAAATVHDALEVLDGVLSSHSDRAKLGEIAIKAPALAAFDLQHSQSVADLSDEAAGALASNARSRIRLEIECVGEAVATDAGSRKRILHPTFELLAAAIKQWDVEAYARAYSDCELAFQTQYSVRLAESAIEAFAAQAPATASVFYEERTAPEWPERLSRLDAAWRWAAARRWISNRSDPLEVARISGKAAQARRDVSRITASVAAHRAWQQCFERMTPREETALKAWSEAIRRVGGGTGKNAHRHRVAAQKHLAACRTAIPAWIMPLYRVVETMHPGKDVFDVIIIDEASQLGPEGLLLHALGKKVIVVGDDQQISPTSFLKDDDVHKLRSDYVRDLPLEDMLDPKVSMFAQARTRFPGAVTLREHFRCMPEIIEFSNRTCYSRQPLIPMRQFGTDRLDPVVEAVYVPNATTLGVKNRYNMIEAHAVVERVLACIDAPEYDGKTMGIISLIGDTQAKYIEKLLLERMDPDEIERRRIVCGDAYAFQGDERDVMFLSMVTAPNSKTTSLTDDTYRQRFNVAASRARDQVFLFYSSKLAQLPSPEDLRYRLLEYFLNPEVQRLDPSGIDIAALRESATNSGERQHEHPPHPFDSWFEVDVFFQLYDRGYRVIPQVEQEDYSVDLVVQGISGRIAVECDGDAWHGPEQYEADMFRQRALERCGLHFFRVRGSTYYADPIEALEPLWDMLHSHGIRPESQWSQPSASVTDSDESEPSIDLAVYTSDDELGAHAQLVISKIIEDLPSDGDAEQTAMDFISASVPVRIDIHDVVDESDYATWQGTVPDPITQEKAAVAHAMLQIVAVEGPVTMDRVVSCYLAALGISSSESVGTALARTKSAIRSVIRSCLRDGSLIESDEIGWGDDYTSVLRVPETPYARVRPRGPRTVSQLPPTEIAAAVARHFAGRAGQTKREFRQVVSALYGFVFDDPVDDEVAEAAWREYRDSVLATNSN